MVCYGLEPQGLAVDFQDGCGALRTLSISDQPGCQVGKMDVSHSPLPHPTTPSFTEPAPASLYGMPVQCWILPRAPGQILLLWDDALLLLLLRSRVTDGCGRWVRSLPPPARFRYESGWEAGFQRVWQRGQAREVTRDAPKSGSRRSGSCHGPGDGCTVAYS